MSLWAKVLAVVVGLGMAGIAQAKPAGGHLGHRNGLRGVFESYDAKAKTITITTKVKGVTARSTVTVNVTDTLLVKLDGQTSSIDQLVKGARVRLIGASAAGGTATEIDVVTRHKGHKHKAASPTTNPATST